MTTLKNLIDAKFPLKSMANPTNSDINTVLNAILPTAGLIAAQTVAGAEYDETTDGVQTLLAADDGGDRVVQIFITVTETFADGDGSQPTFSFGQTGSATKFGATTVLNDATAGQTFVLVGTLTDSTALIVTAVDAEGDGAGAISVVVTALPAST